ncbi:helix-turn-helix domain-containing protein [Nocardioides zeae]|uniref:Helix-turn-helix domain-containing protein n=1 Tax=Nocardioides imazamoxiresistens TaxID=3231893 RepID=A0ABU3PWC2_9ACTN|nr:helix-turn-helix domain-containing protein [Nocardioides zeae]MDT9593523.1 helix-turn-helix domain-containing protein [Nocardioides zeae]
MRSTTAAFLERHHATRVQPLADRLVATIRAENAGYAHVPAVADDDLRTSCVDNVARVLELLALELAAPVGEAAGEAAEAGGDDQDRYDAAEATGRRRAEQGLPLDDVLRSFRMGGRLIWDDLLDQAGDALDAREARELGTALWAVVDRTSAAVAAAYHHAEVSAVRVHEQRRTALWEDLLAGRGADPGFAAEAGRVLDIGTGPCVVVVADAATSGEAAASAEVNLRSAGHGSSWVRRAVGLVGVVETHGPVPVLAPALRVLTAGATGVSGVVPGLARVEEAFRQAVDAQRVAASRGLACLTYDDALPDALLLAAPAVAARLVEHWLGPVLDLPVEERRALVETLEAWVAVGGSTTATASALPCHRNTVLNRLRRVQQVSGGRVGAGVPAVELALALAAYRLGLRS